MWWFKDLVSCSSITSLPFFWGGRAACGPGLCWWCLCLAVSPQALCPRKNLQTLRASGPSAGHELVLWGREEAPCWNVWGHMFPGKHRAAAASPPRTAASLGAGCVSQLSALRAWRMRLAGLSLVLGHHQILPRYVGCQRSQWLWRWAPAVMGERCHEMSFRKFQMLLGIL